MADDFYVELENIDWDSDGNAEPIEYHFDLIQNKDASGNIPTTSVEGDQDINNQNLSFQGKNREIVLEWILYDDGTDKSDGTYGTSGISDDRISDGTIETIEEQDTFLEKYIHDSTLGASWRFYGGKYSDPDGDGTDEGTPVSVVSVNVRKVSTQPLRAVGTIRMQVGQVV